MALYSASQKAIDIVLTSYNRLKLTKATIAAIQERTDHPFNLHVIDNASTDGSINYLMQLYSNGSIQRLVLNDYNTGMVMPKAQAVSLCSSPIFIITDCDVLPPERKGGKCWLTESIERMETDKNLFAMTLAISKAKAKPWASVNGINYCRLMGQTFQFFRQEVFESMGGEPPIYMPERKCDDDKEQPLFSPVDTRICNLITQAGYRVGYTDDLWGDHIGSGVTKFGDPFWGYGSAESVPMKRRVGNEDEYKRHGYVDCDPVTNRPIDEAFIKRYHTINPLSVFSSPFNPMVLDGFMISCEHNKNVSFVNWDCDCRHRATKELDQSLNIEIVKR